MDLVVRRLRKAKQEKAWLLNSCIQIKDFESARRSWTVPPAPEKHFRGSVWKSHPGKEGQCCPEWRVWEGKGAGEIRACCLSLCPQQFPCPADLTYSAKISILVHRDLLSVQKKRGGPVQYFFFFVKAREGVAATRCIFVDGWNWAPGPGSPPAELRFGAAPSRGEAERTVGSVAIHILMSRSDGVWHGRYF